MENMDMENFEANSLQVSTQDEAETYRTNCVDQLPSGCTNQVHFYFVKYFRSIEHPSIGAKIEETGKLIRKLKQARSEIAEKLQQRKLDLQTLSCNSWRILRYRWGCRDKIRWKVQEIEKLQQALDKLLHTSKKPRQSKVTDVCSPEEKLDNHIMSLKNRILHGGNNLVKERQLLREIKEAKAEREMIILENATKPVITIYWGSEKVISSKEEIKDKIKIMSREVKELKMKQLDYSTKARRYKEKMEAAENDVRILQREFENINRKKDRAYEYIHELKRRRFEANACHYQYLSLLKSAKELAIKKDVAGLEELSSNQVEKHMSEWSESKAFREDYHKRMLSAVNRRRPIKSSDRRRYYLP